MSQVEMALEMIFSSCTKNIELTPADNHKATFTGTLPEGTLSLRFVYPYDANTDMASPYAALRANTYLVGNFVGNVNAVGPVSLSHICTYINVRLKFSNLPASSKLQRLELSSEALWAKGNVNMDCAPDDASIITDKNGHTIVVSLYDSENEDLVNGTIYTIPIAAIPTTFTSETPVTLTAYFTSGGVLKKNTTAFTITPNRNIIFERGTYNNLSFSCDMTNTTEVSEYWSAAGAFAGGAGTQAEPYLISTPEQLAHLASLVNGGANQSGKFFKVTNDIDLSGKKWTCIGNNSKAFNGYFDGGHHTISGLYYVETLGHAGLFGHASSATISNINVEGYIWATGKTSGEHTNVGGIVGLASGGTVINCSFSGSVTSYSNTGGIIGFGSSSPKVVNCYNDGFISSTGTSSQTVAGILGFGGGSVYNCYNTGYVSVHGGMKDGITNCSATNSFSIDTTPTTKGASKTKEQMQSADFATLLNTWIDNNIATYPALIKWKTTPGSTFPTFVTRY